MIRLLFVIRELGHGGAERQLIELARGLDPRRFSTTVVTLYGGGGLLADLKATSDVEFVSLEKRSRWDLATMFARLGRVVRQRRPQIIHGYMPMANELSLLAGKAVGAKVVWGVRTSLLELNEMDLPVRAVFQAGKVMSRWADLIISNSRAGRDFHVKFGYRADRMIVIPNGVNVDRFREDTDAGSRLRAEWGVGANEVLVGLVARLDWGKDHETFLRSAAGSMSRCPELRFVCVGGGPAGERRRLEKLAESLGLGSRLLWTGPRSDLPAVYSAIDVLVSSSCAGEGFSNSVGEAMSCAVRCVVTDVGDSAQVVGGTGAIVPPRRPDLLADAIVTTVASKGRARCPAARERIVTQYTHRHLVDATTAALEGLLA